MKQLLQLDPKKFGEFVTSEAVVTVASSVIIAPILLNRIESMVKSNKKLASHITIVMVVVSFVIFVLAKKLSGMLQAIALGVAGAFLITAVKPFIDQVMPQV